MVLLRVRLALEVSGMGNAGPSIGYAESGEDIARVELVLEKLPDRCPRRSRGDESGGRVATSVMGDELEADEDSGLEGLRLLAIFPIVCES